MQRYREKLLQAAYEMVGPGDINMRLSHVAVCLLQLDDSDVPVSALVAFERVRDPLIQKPLVANGTMLPRDLGESEAKAAALGLLDLVVAEMSGVG